MGICVLYRRDPFLPPGRTAASIYQKRKAAYRVTHTWSNLLYFVTPIREGLVSLVLVVVVNARSKHPQGSAGRVSPQWLAHAGFLPVTKLRGQTDCQSAACL